MPQADSNRTVLRYIPEVTWGVTPGTPTMIEMAPNASRLTHEKRTVISDRLRPDRQVPGILQVGANAAGDVPFELSYSDFDAFLESALGGSFTNDVLTNGVEDHFFSIEQEAVDIGEYMLFSGQYVAGMEINVQAEAIITGTMTFLGKQGIASSSTVAASTLPVSDNPIMTATANVGSLEEGGNPLATALRRVSFNFNPNRGARSAIANLYPISIRGGRMEVSGSMEAYFEDLTLVQKFIAHTPSSLSVTLTDDLGNSYVIFLPRIKYTGSGTPDVPGVNQDVMLPLEWQAERDPVTGYTISITRAAAP